MTVFRLNTLQPLVSLHFSGALYDSAAVLSGRAPGAPRGNLAQNRIVEKFSETSFSMKGSPSRLGNESLAAPAN